MPKVGVKAKKTAGGMDAELETLLGQVGTLQVRVGGGSATSEASWAALARGGVGALYRGYGATLPLPRCTDSKGCSSQRRG